METQERIVNKAHELFMRYGIRSVSMDEIATQLGMSKKTIYQFYADKDALVAGVVDIEIELNQCKCMEHNKNAENPVHEIFLAVDMVQELLTTMNPAVIFDMEKFHPTAYKKFNDHKNKFMFEIIKNNLDKGIELGLYREGINTIIMSRFRLASTFLVFNPELFPHSKFSLSQIIEEITDNFLHGLVTPKGIKLIQKYKQQRLKP